jgi:hypothetical protein
MGIGEAAEKQIHFARAAMPGAITRPPSARIKAGGISHVAVCRRRYLNRLDKSLRP